MINGLLIGGVAMGISIFTHWLLKKRRPHPILVDLFGDVDLPHHVPHHIADGFGLIERVFSVSLAGAGETPAVA